MKKNGFTLIELIGVLTLLALIALIALPNIDSVIKKSREGSLKSVAKSLETSTRAWLTDNRDLFANSGDLITITLLDLKEAGLVDIDIKNPVTQVCLANNNQITIQWIKDVDNNRYEIHVPNKLSDGSNDVDGDGIVDDCNGVEKSPSLYLVGTNPVNLPLGSDLTKLYENISGTDTDGMDIIAKSLDNDDITRNVTTNFSFTTGSTKVIKNGILTYTVESGGFTKSINRRINIVDTIPPVLSGTKESITIDKSASNYNFLSGVSASDNHDGNITSNIIVKSNVEFGTVGSYYVLYTVSDSSKNTTTHETRVIIKN